MNMTTDMANHRQGFTESGAPLKAIPQASTQKSVLDWESLHQESF